jgi:molybdopterin molybdotransferase
MGMIRDVNGPMLSAAVTAAGGEPICLGILPDMPQALEKAVSDALEISDMVLLSGGSSVGVKDAAEKVLTSLGEMDRLH